MFTDDQLEKAIELLEPRDPVTGKLTGEAVSLLRTALRRLEEVREHPAAYTDLEAKLATAQGTDALQLQAGLTLLKGPQANAGEVAKAGGRSATYFTKSTNRNDILDTLLMVLYPPRLANVTGQYNASAQMNNPAAEAYRRRGCLLDEERLTNRD